MTKRLCRRINKGPMQGHGSDEEIIARPLC